MHDLITGKALDIQFLYCYYLYFHLHKRKVKSLTCFKQTLLLSFLVMFKRLNCSLHTCVLDGRTIILKMFFFHQHLKLSITQPMWMNNVTTNFIIWITKFIYVLVHTWYLHDMDTSCVTLQMMPCWCLVGIMAMRHHSNSYRGSSESHMDVTYFPCHATISTC